MATELALARSFYSWLTKIKLIEQEDLLIIPNYLPTRANNLLLLIENIEVNIKQEIHKKRLQYWKNLFLSFREINDQ